MKKVQTGASGIYPLSVEFVKRGTGWWVEGGNHDPNNDLFEIAYHEVYLHNDNLQSLIDGNKILPNLYYITAAKQIVPNAFDFQLFFAGDGTSG